MGAQSYGPALEIEGYNLERDNLAMANIRTRTAVFISQAVTYKRRIDLEIAETPMIWLEIEASRKKSWLISIGYRQWRTLKNKKKYENGQSVGTFQKLD